MDKVDTLTILPKSGINERLEKVQEQANDTMYLITDYQDKHEKIEREISRLRFYVIRL